jgi:hypothetical protein
VARTTKKVSWELIGAIGAAIAASVCCVVPLVLITLCLSLMFVHSDRYSTKNQIVKIC